MSHIFLSLIGPECLHDYLCQVLIVVKYLRSTDIFNKIVIYIEDSQEQRLKDFQSVEQVKNNYLIRTYYFKLSGAPREIEPETCHSAFSLLIYDCDVCEKSNLISYGRH